MSEKRIPQDWEDQLSRNVWARQGRAAIHSSHTLSPPLVRAGQSPLKFKAPLPQAAPQPAADGFAIPPPVLKKRQLQPLPGDSCYRSPIAGLVVTVSARVGEEVRPGQSVLVIEAMKMQNEVRSESGGRLKAIRVAAGDSVKPGQILFELTSDAARIIAAGS